MMYFKLTLLLFAFVCFHTQAYSADTAKDFLSKHEPIWYDAQNDSWKRARANINTEEPAEEPEQEGDFWGSFVQMLIYLIIGALIAYLIYVFLSYYANKPSPEVIDRSDQQQYVREIKVSDLPFQAQADLDNPLLALDKARQQGDWKQVAIYCLIVLLTDLHKAQFIQLRPGKTNRHYLREVANAPDQFQKVLKHCVQFFERSFFGHLPIKEDYADQLYQHVKRCNEELARKGSQA